jgi:hypothetical protein
MEAAAPEELHRATPERVSACSREAAIGAMLLRVDELNGVWNSKWERSNPFGRRRPRQRKPSSQISRLRRHGGLARRAPSDVTRPLRSLPA